MSFTTVPTHLPGDTFPSADWNIAANNLNSGVWRTIADTKLAAAAASIDFTSIPQTYAHLMVVLFGRGDVAATSVTVGIRINNDSGANYEYAYMQANSAGTVSGLAGSGSTSIGAPNVPAISAVASRFGAIRFEVPHYTSGFHHPVVGQNFFDTDTDFIARNFGGLWRAGAAVTRITLFPTSGNFITDSRATLYAMSL